MVSHEHARSSQIARIRHECKWISVENVLYALASWTAFLPGHGYCDLGRRSRLVYLEKSKKNLSYRSLACLNTVDLLTLAYDLAEALLSANSVSHSITMTAPSLRTIASLPLFILASGVQHDCHMYLASLPKYTLPIHPNFQSLICPHYTAECLIYFSLSVLAAPNGLLFNRTILAALVFVSVNLSVTASTAKEWHAQKFGKETVRGRWKMIPYLY